MILSRSHKTMILSLVMILVLLTTWTIAPLSSSRAVLVGVTVVGEVVMTLATLASLMMIALGASGMDGALRNQAAATGTQPLTYVGQLLNRWLSSAATDMGFSLLAQKMQQGLSYLPDGTLYLDSEATAAVADFQRWAWSASGADLVDYAPVNAPDYLTDGTFDVALVVCSLSVEISGTTYYYPSQGFIPSNSASWRLMTVASTLPGTQYYVYGYEPRNNSGTVTSHKIFAAPANVYSAFNVSLFYGGGDTCHVGTEKALSIGQFTQVVSASAGGEYSGIPLNETQRDTFVVDDFSGDPVPIGDLDTFVGPALQDQGTQLPLANTVTVSAEAAAQLHLDNYLRAAAAAYAGTGTASVPVTDVGTGDEDTLPLSVPLDTPIGVTGVTDAAIDQSGSVAGSDAVASDFEGLDDYTMDLTQFFPFCVPFDLAYLFEKLRADPEALVIDWHFMIPYLDVDIPVRIDLSAFDSLAQLLRSLEVIAFIVALLIGTKNLIQGGD